MLRWAATAALAAVAVTSLTACGAVKGLIDDASPDGVLRDFPAYADSLAGVISTRNTYTNGGPLEGGTYVQFTVALDPGEDRIDSVTRQLATWIAHQPYGPRMHIEVTVALGASSVDISPDAGWNRKRLTLLRAARTAPEVQAAAVWASWHDGSYRNADDGNYLSLVLARDHHQGVLGDLIDAWLSRVTRTATGGDGSITIVPRIDDRDVNGTAQDGARRVVQVKSGLQPPLMPDSIAFANAIDARNDLAGYVIDPGQTVIALAPEAHADATTQIRALPFAAAATASIVPAAPAG